MCVCDGCDGRALSVSQVIEAKTPQAVVGVEGEDARVDARSVSSIYLVRALTVLQDAQGRARPHTERLSQRRHVGLRDFPFSDMSVLEM